VDVSGTLILIVGIFLGICIAAGLWTYWLIRNDEWYQ
jgi:hypothetical protein